MSNPLPEKQVLRVKQLLRETDMTYQAIATRTGCGHTSVGRINRTHRIRKSSASTK